MKVFITGATGFIGSAIVRELLAAGHQVLGLARSDTAAASLAAEGAEVQRGALDDLASLRSGAATSDGVIHLAYGHDFSQYEAAARTDQRAIETLGEELAGSQRPFVIASGTALLPHGRLVTEEDVPDTVGFGAIRGVAEGVALSFATSGVRVSVVRPAPSVHGEGDHGFITALIGIAREKGISGYIGDGSNRWPAVHRLDAAHLFRLALEKASAGSVLHAVADEGVPFRAIAEVIGRHLDLPVVAIAPENAGEHFGWFGAVVALDSPASNTLTRERLQWQPMQPELLADLDQGHYFKNER